MKISDIKFRKSLESGNLKAIASLTIDGCIAVHELKVIETDHLFVAMPSHKDENGNSIGAEIQGTNSEKRYKGVAAGTGDSLFSVTIGTPTKAYIFESAIDLLSFRQLANQQRIQNSLLVSMAGLKPNSLKALSERGLQLFACVDNDEAGRRFISSNNLTQRNHILKEFGVKDFNELLIKIRMLQQKTEKRPLNRKHPRH